MKKIPLKNYIIYSIIILVTFAISIYIVMLFNRSKEYYENNSVLADVLYEILPKNNLSVSDNLNNYLLENSNLIIYISSGKDKDIKEFENSFKSYIIENNLKKDIIYIDSNDIKKSNFIEDLFNNYASNDVILSNKPMYYFFVFLLSLSFFYYIYFLYLDMLHSTYQFSQIK